MFIHAIHTQESANQKKRLSNGVVLHYGIPYGGDWEGDQALDGLPEILEAVGAAQSDWSGVLIRDWHKENWLYITPKIAGFTNQWSHWGGARHERA